MASWPGILIWCVRSVDALVSDRSRTFLDPLVTALCRRFASRLVWLASSPPR
ncbi:hypothetical protein EV363DRAFT_1152888 [Boletus edulis]|nr:hypothetical protein EV363DRAFT_1184760 [Boletus edulis]KAF8123186.1 hypothetical protein EV363DRAFT_1180538 [Boletus edulis]KAF8125867.1 hypothetical protein EV363DRAFT_1175318 [Boletus edulis]KAF8129559.1 hypothetical protein EV363DRAFT_1168745 [Boletus edulis]KAF8130966.1 hypothetical protein EV363DRAFT_1165904 [Boletus edulis]